MPKTRIKKEISCLGCGKVQVTVPDSWGWETANIESEKLGYDTTAFCSKACEKYRIAKAMWGFRIDPQMLLAHMFGKDKQTYKDRQRFENSKRSKAAFA